MVAGGLLVGVGDGEESGFAVEPAGEGDRAGPGRPLVVKPGKTAVGWPVRLVMTGPHPSRRKDRLSPSARPSSASAGCVPARPQVLDGRHELALAERAGPAIQPSVTWLRVKSSKTAAASVSEHQGDASNGQLFGQRDGHQLKAELAQDLQLFALVGRPVGCSSM